MLEETVDMCGIFVGFNNLPVCSKLWVDIVL